MSTAKVLISASACHPEGDREAEAAWAWCRAAAATHDVHLVTSAGSARRLTAELTRRPVPSLTVVGVDLPAPRRLTWGRQAARTIRRLHAEQHFDVIHHLATDTDRYPTGLVRRTGARVIWGPAGASEPVPLPLTRWLDGPGLEAELLRRLFTAPAQRVANHRLRQHVDLVVARDHEAAHAYRGTGSVAIHPAVVMPRLNSGGPQRHERASADGRTALFVGRLIPSRGLVPAITTLARPGAEDWELRVIGDGPDWRRADRLADRLGVRDRVEFLGELPRADVLRAMSTADALLSPTLGDSAGWAVAEALASGCPVVCLDRGAPPVLVGPGEGAVVAWQGDLPGALASGLAGLRGRIEPVDRWAPNHLGDVLAEWYEGSAVSREGTSPAG
ncbi:glycosyltransferase family 4 protein [Kribbella deserti]|uniref:Glycosyltransferase family 4 protein n=1 Tax=Kribbella deserti TaxID=1926257 RepID=A0ABV6QIK0_9ACTN